MSLSLSIVSYARFWVFVLFDKLVKIISTMEREIEQAKVGDAWVVFKFGFSNKMETKYNAVLLLFDVVSIRLRFELSMNLTNMMDWYEQNMYIWKFYRYIMLFVLLTTQKTLHQEPYTSRSVGKLFEKQTQSYCVSKTTKSKVRECVVFIDFSVNISILMTMKLLLRSTAIDKNANHNELWLIGLHRRIVLTRISYASAFFFFDLALCIPFHSND